MLYSDYIVSTPLITRILQAEIGGRRKRKAIKSLKRLYPKAFMGPRGIIPRDMGRIGGKNFWYRIWKASRRYHASKNGKVNL